MNYLAFKKFLAAAGLSTRRFGDLCGIGKTTVHRLTQTHHGGLTPKYVKSITPTLLRACLDHLTASGAAADAIHLILSDIFGDEFVPSIIARATLTPDMLRFFGLARDPFAAPRNASGVFLTQEMEDIKSLLEDAVRYQGFVAVLAPVGAGKTVLKNLLLSSAERCNASAPLAGAGATRSRTVGGSPTEQPPCQRRYDGIILSPKFADTSRITSAGIVAYILEEFQIKPRRSLLLAQKQLEDHLAELTIPVTLCFDECHRLSDTTLTALKNFYELGTGGFQRYLGLVLFGQPQFETRLQLPRFREIAERLSVHRLPPFSAEDTENFLNHCLQLARLFSPRSQVQSPKPEELPAPVPGLGAGAPSSMGRPTSTIRSPESQPLNNGPTLDLGHRTLDSVFAPDAILSIASRAGVPLAVANLAAAGMIEAYRMGEPLVLARFIPGDPGPRTSRIAK